MPDNSDLDSLDEGVEFGYRLNDNEWIPLAWYSSRANRNDSIKAGTLTNNNLMVQGFHLFMETHTMLH